MIRHLSSLQKQPLISFAAGLLVNRTSSDEGPRCERNKLAPFGR